MAAACKLRTPSHLWCLQLIILLIFTLTLTLAHQVDDLSALTAVIQVNHLRGALQQI